MISKRLFIGALLVVLLVSGIVYVSFGQEVKLRIDPDKSTFYVFNNNTSRWIVSGREYNRLFDGTSRMNRRASSITVETVIGNNNVTITRTTPYIRGPVIIDTYYFEGNMTDKKMFPIFHKVEVFNGSGFFYRYEVRDLEYDGDTEKMDGNYMKFGKDMVVSWQKDYRWAWVYKTGILKVQYDIPTDYEVYDVRLFDPKEKYLKLISTTVDLAWAEEKWEICNPGILEYKDGISLSWGGDTKYLKGVELLKDEIYYVKDGTPIWNKTKRCNKQLPNETKPFCWNDSEIIGSNQTLVKRMRRVPWDNKVSPTLTSTPKCENITLRAKLKPVLGERKIHIVPTAFGYSYPEYSWWNTTWGHRRRLLINTSGTPLNYTSLTVELNITETNAKDDFSDLRFIQSDDSTDMFACNWTQNDASDVIVWLNITEYTNSSGLITVFMYYNYSAAVATWNCNATFPFYDGFENYAPASQLDGQGGWTGVSGGDVIATITPFEGANYVSQPDVAGDKNANHAVPSGLNTTVVGTKARVISGTGSFDRFTLIHSGGAEYSALQFRLSIGSLAILTDTPPTWRALTAYTDNIWYDWNFTLINTTWLMVCANRNDAASVCRIIDARTNGVVDTIQLSNPPDGTNDESRWDSVYIANSTYPAPTYSLGVEEDTPVIGDTCDTCTIDCTENCVVDSDLDCSNGMLTFTGRGAVSIRANIINYNNIEVHEACEVEGLYGFVFDR